MKLPDEGRGKHKTNHHRRKLLISKATFRFLAKFVDFAIKNYKLEILHNLFQGPLNSRELANLLVIEKPLYF